MLFFLAFLVGMAQAALVKIDSAGDPLFVYINGSFQGSTPIILELGDGRYRVDCRWDEFGGRTMRYTLEIYGQSKGKLTADWDQDEWRVIWAEQLERPRDLEGSTPRHEEPDPYEEDPYEENLYDDLDRYEEINLYDEPEDDEQDERERNRQEALRLAEEELLRAEAEAANRRQSLEEQLRQAELDRLAAEERARELAERQRELLEQHARLEEQAQREAREEAARRAEEGRRLAEERRKAEEQVQREAAEQARWEAEERRKAEEQARREEQERERDEAEANRQAERERQRAEAEFKRQAEQEALRARYLPHRRAGQAYLDEGDTHRAVHALREAIAAGDSDKDVAALVRKIDSESCTLSLRLVGQQEGVEPLVLLAPRTGEPFPADKVQGTRLTFRDVPSGAPLAVLLGGAGYDHTEVPVDAPTARRTTRVTGELSWLGLATLQLEEWPHGVVVSVTDIHEKHEPQEEGELQVTAGKVAVALSGPSGRRQFLLEVGADSSQTLDIKGQLPGAVRVAGIPAGTKLAWAKAPDGAPRSLPTLPRDAFVGEQQGVGIAAPQILESLPPGAYQLSLWHPVLGKSTIGFEPVPGEVSDQQVAWESMSKGPAVQAAYRDWERRFERSKRMPLATKLSIGGAGATAALAGVSTMFMIQAQQARSDINGVSASYDQALTDEDYDNAWDLFAERVALEDGLGQRNTLFFGGVGLTAVGAGVSTTLFLRGRAKKNNVPQWDLYGLGSLPSTHEPAPIPTPEPRAQPTDEAIDAGSTRQIEAAQPEPDREPEDSEIPEPEESGEPPPPEDDPNLFNDVPVEDPAQFLEEIYEDDASDEAFQLEGE